MMTNKETRLITAGRCRKNRIVTICSCVRWALLTPSAESRRALVCVPLSLIADPRVEHAVQQVCHEVGEDDDDPARQQPAHQRVRSEERRVGKECRCRVETVKERRMAREE